MSSYLNPCVDTSLRHNTYQALDENMMKKEDANHTLFRHAIRILWKVFLAAVLVFLIERFIRKGLAHPRHQVKPIFALLSVLFTIVLATVAILLIYLAIQDCRNTYEAVRGRMEVKPPSVSIAKDCPTAVSEQV